MQKKNKLALVYWAIVAIVVYFFVATMAQAEGDVSVKCYTHQQVEQKQENVRFLLKRAYNWGHQEGMIHAVKTMRESILQHCATAKPEDAYIHMGEGVYLPCPEKAEK